MQGETYRVSSSVCMASRIPGGLPEPGLAAQVIVSNASDHIPWNRQQRPLARRRLKISRQTTRDWSLAAAELTRPLS